MNIKMIDPFLQSAQLVFDQVINVSTNHGKIKNTSFNPSILIEVSITGEVKGNLLLGMEEKVAIHIVERMMGGMKITEISDMEKSAISELGNMIGGNASMLLSEQGLNIDITPPKIIERNTDYVLEEAFQIPLTLEGIGEVRMLLTINRDSELSLQETL